MHHFLMALGGGLSAVATPLIVASSSKEPEKLDAWGVMKKAAQRAGQGGLAGPCRLYLTSLPHRQQ
jgi:hypothetical protein